MRRHTPSTWAHAAAPALEGASSAQANPDQLGVGHPVARASIVLRKRCIALPVRRRSFTNLRPAGLPILLLPDDPGASGFLALATCRL